eukprot:7397615-Pyramimonas_sp.AAC.1
MAAVPPRAGSGTSLLAAPSTREQEGACRLALAGFEMPPAARMSRRAVEPVREKCMASGGYGKAAIKASDMSRKAAFKFASATACADFLN